MKMGEKGYVLMELLIAITIMFLASSAAGAVIFQTFRNTERNTDIMTAVHQVETAGYWISRDARMALNLTTTDNLTLPEFLSISWTEWDGTGSPIYHSANYSFVDLVNGIGKLKRTYGSSAGASEQTMVAQYIYYDLSDADVTSNTSYQNSILTVKLTAVFGEYVETREYAIKRRPDF